jgi:hypothetical protein
VSRWSWGRVLHREMGRAPLATRTVYRYISTLTLYSCTATTVHTFRIPKPIPRANTPAAPLRARLMAYIQKDTPFSPVCIHISISNSFLGTYYLVGFDTTGHRYEDGISQKKSPAKSPKIIYYITLSSIHNTSLIQPFSKSSERALLTQEKSRGHDLLPCRKPKSLTSFVLLKAEN